MMMKRQNVDGSVRDRATRGVINSETEYRAVGIGSDLRLLISTSALSRRPVSIGNVRLSMGAVVAVDYKDSLCGG